MPKYIELSEHTLNSIVDSIVHTSVDDGKMSVKHLCERQSHPTANRLRILRAALAAEKEGAARSSLLAAIRGAIRSQEAALDGAGLDPIYEAAAEVATPDPVEEVEDDAEEEAEPVLAGVADLGAFMIHPDLEAISMMEDAHKWLAKNHHGDATRRDASEEISRDWEAFVDEIREHGVREMIKVVPAATLPAGFDDDGVRWQIVDGRHRWQASTQAGLATIPYEVVDLSEVRAIIEGTIAARRNYTKGQKAFIAVQFHPELLAGQGARHDIGTECRSYTQPEICAKYGVGERVLRQAIELHQKTAGKKKLGEEVRMQVWAGFGLGGILSGLAGKEATGAKPRKPSDIGTISRTLASYRSQVREFASWPRTHRVAFADELRGMVEASPPEVNQLLSALLSGDDAAVNEILNASIPEHLNT